MLCTLGGYGSRVFAFGEPQDDAEGLNLVGELEQTFGEGRMPTTRADVTVNGADLPPLTAEQIARLEALAARPDPEIDDSEIPPLSDAFWTHAVRGRYHRRIAAPKPGE